jgi:hypothetical protein
MSAVAENISIEMPAPILFTDSAAAKVADLIAEEGNPGPETACICPGRWLLGLPVWFHL